MTDGQRQPEDQGSAMHCTTLNTEQTEALGRVLDYLWRDEEKNYVGHTDNGEGEGHIFIDVLTLSRAVDRVTDLKCQTCGTVEPITSFLTVAGPTSRYRDPRECRSCRDRRLARPDAEIQPMLRPDRHSATLPA
jgi:hypothetical protein